MVGRCNEENESNKRWWGGVMKKEDDKRWWGGVMKKEGYKRWWGGVMKRMRVTRGGVVRVDVCLWP